MHARQLYPWLGAVLVAALAVICLVNAAQSVRSQPWQWSIPGDVTSSPSVSAEASHALDIVPGGVVDAFGDPVFWTVLGLVVLGYFVLAADTRQNNN